MKRKSFYPLKQIYNLLKFIVLAIIVLLIWRQILDGDTIAFTDHFRERLHKGHYLIYLVVLTVIMPINWILEGRKWQLLMAPFENISLKKAIKIIVSGVAVGIVTPGRIGEYAGRLVASDPTQKTEVITATLLGSIAQNFWNILGGVALSYVFFKNTLQITTDYQIFFMWISILEIIFMIWVYYSLPKMVSWLQKWWKKPSKWIERVKGTSIYTTDTLNQVLILSMLRYLIYFSQYFLMMLFLGVEVYWLDMAAMIAGIYLIQTGIPLPAFMSVFARGEVAILVWSTLGVESITALTATFLLWLINLIVPALVGLYVLSRADVRAYFR